MFLYVSVILYTGGVSREPPRTRETPPRTKENPPRPGRPPQDQGDPPGTRQTPQTKENPPGRENPHPRPRRTLPGKKTAAYGQWAAGTHPTGMHSCLNKFLPRLLFFFKSVNIEKNYPGNVLIILNTFLYPNLSWQKPLKGKLMQMLSKVLTAFWKDCSRKLQTVLHDFEKRSWFFSILKVGIYE